jgi:hypothetical protein
MARERSAAQADGLAAEAWAAGCREVQAAINWATLRGEVAGPRFQAAFRKAMAAQEPAPPAAAPATLPADPGATSGGDRGKRSRQGRAAQVKPGTRAGGPGSRGTQPAKPDGGGPAAGESAPPVARGASAAGDPKPATPAEFVEDMRRLRHLVAKYGRKGLADLIGMFGD